MPICRCRWTSRHRCRMEVGWVTRCLWRINRLWVAPTHPNQLPWSQSKTTRASQWRSWRLYSTPTMRRSRQKWYSMMLLRKELLISRRIWPSHKQRGIDLKLIARRKSLKRVRGHWRILKPAVSAEFVAIPAGSLETRAEPDPPWFRAVAQCKTKKMSIKCRKRTTEKFQNIFRNLTNKEKIRRSRDWLMRRIRSVRRARVKCRKKSA